mgnify:CR=1 FL=1
MGAAMFVTHEIHTTWKWHFYENPFSTISLLALDGKLVLTPVKMVSNFSLYPVGIEEVWSWDWPVYINSFSAYFFQ